MAPLVLSNYNFTLEHLFRKSPSPPPSVLDIPTNKVDLFHLFKWLSGLNLKTKTEKIAEILAINNGNITHFRKAQAILRGWFIKKLSIYFNPQCSKKTISLVIALFL